jgi:LPS-assembly lipoprotein
MKHRLRLLIITALALITSACGFHLRNSMSFSAGVEPIYITTTSNELYVALRNSLNASNVALSDNIESASHILTITKLVQDKRSSALGEGATIIEYLLIETITFELQEKNGKVVFGPATISERNTMENDSNKVVSSQQEEQTLREEMRKNLANKLLRQLQTYQPTTLSVDNKK